MEINTEPFVLERNKLIIKRKNKKKQLLIIFI